MKILTYFFLSLSTKRMILTKMMIHKTFFVNKGIGAALIKIPITSARTPYIGNLPANCARTAPNIAGRTKGNTS